MADRLIGIDAGGTMTKVAVFDPEGRELGCETHPNKMLFPAPGRTERDPDAMWDATCRAIAKVLEVTGTKPEDVAAVTPSGFGSGIFLVGKDGAVVRPGFVSTDSRSAETVAGWAGDGRKSAIEPLVQAEIWPGQTLAILGWLDRHEPETFERTHAVLACKDFLRLRLTGSISTDPTDAGCFGLMDTRSGEYSDEALSLAGLSHWRDRLPEIKPSTSVSGTVSEEAARLTGLKAGTPVGQGVYDVVGCSLASGLRSADELGIVAGTFSINSTLHRQPTIDPLPTLQSPYPIGGYSIATTATPRSASNLEWFVKTLLPAEIEAQKATGRSIYDYCSALVEENIEGPSDLVFLPYLFDGPGGAPAGLMGAKVHHELGDIVRAVYEGIVFAHRMDIERLLTGADAAEPSMIRLAGGPARSDVWSQMFADALGLPVEIARGSEFGAKGAAMCGAVAVGLYADMPSAIEAMVAVERRFEPRPERTEVLEAAYRKFTRMSDAIAAATAEIADLEPSAAQRSAA